MKLIILLLTIIFIISTIKSNDVKKGSTEACFKDAYSRGTGTVPDKDNDKKCGKDEEKSFGLCYKKCKTDYEGIGPLCWDSCKSSKYPVNGGIFCCAK